MPDAAPDPLFAAAASAFATPFDGVILIEPKEGGALWIDGAANPPAVLDAAPSIAEPRCTWRASRDTLMRILGGERLLASAYVSGRLTIAGDMSIMARLHLKGPERG